MEAKIYLFKLVIYLVVNKQINPGLDKQNIERQNYNSSLSQ